MIWDLADGRPGSVPGSDLRARESLVKPLSHEESSRQIITRRVRLGGAHSHWHTDPAVKKFIRVSFFQEERGRPYFQAQRSGQFSGAHADLEKESEETR